MLFFRSCQSFGVPVGQFVVASLVCCIISQFSCFLIHLILTHGKLWWETHVPIEMLCFFMVCICYRRNWVLELSLNPKHFLVFWCLNAAYRSPVFNSVFLGFRAFYDWVFDQFLQSSPGGAFQGQPCIQALIALCSTVPGYWFTVVCLHQYHQALDHPELKGFFFMTFFTWRRAYVCAHEQVVESAF